MDYKYAKEGRCYEMVFVRDTYRYTGRTKSRFELHYNKQQCSRAAKFGNYCWQHRKPDTGTEVARGKAK